MAASELTPVRAALLAGPLGIVMLLGGPVRVSGPSFDTVRDTGGEVVWGVGFLLLSVVLLSASHWRSRQGDVLFHAYMTAATGYGLFVAAFVSSAVQLETAGLTGIVVYSWVAYLHMMAAVAAPPGFWGRMVLRRMVQKELAR